jgi:hypothetical protein
MHASAPETPSTASDPTELTASSPSPTKTRGLIYNALFLLLIGYYFGVGGFPAAPVEGDGVSMASGGLQIVQNGWDGPVIAYGRETRPAVFWLLVPLIRLTGADPYVLFSHLSLVAGIVSLLMSSMLLGRLLRIPAALCGMGILLLFPESSTTACLPSGTVLAACFAMTALYLCLRLRESHPLLMIGAGVCASAAILARVDICTVGLASVPLVWAQDWRKSLLRLAIFGITTCVVSLVGFYVADCNVFQILGTTGTVLYSDMNSATDIVKILLHNDMMRGLVIAFPLLTVCLVLWGARTIIRSRKWQTLWVVLAGLLPVLLVYNVRLRGRPLYYTIPFIALLALAGIGSLGVLKKRARIFAVGLAAILFLVQYVMGVNIVMPKKPWILILSLQSQHYFILAGVIF